MLGVTQEQHAERCRLFAQWQEIDWPILHDPINKLGIDAVPIIVEIDDSGVTKSINPKLESFLAAAPEARPVTDGKTRDTPIKRPDLKAVRKNAEQLNSYDGWVSFGDAVMLWGEQSQVSQAITAYRRALRLQPNDASVHFRLGAALRARYDAYQSGGDAAGRTSSRTSAFSTPGTTSLGLFAQRKQDFRSAVEHWQTALDLEPNQYIYRRRIQQYGPRLAKPYPFYDWVAMAQREVAARGEEPIELSVALTGSETAHPRDQFAETTETQEEPDPQGRITRDTKGLVQAEVVVVPQGLKPGETGRVHITLQPEHDTHWNNESGPLVLWLDLPQGWGAEGQMFRSEMPDSAESIERRTIDFEIKLSPTVSAAAQPKAYALYYVCEESRGTCLYLRQDVEIPIEIRSQ